MHIGSVALPNRIFAAPMAGVTDRPFRQLCKRLGAGYAVSEMVTSRRDLWTSLKTSRRANHDGETAPIAVQIAGTDAPMMAEAAAYNIDRGAQIIDINMGCPAKKVCSKVGGVGADAGRAARDRDRRGRGRGLRAARRAGDAEDAHRLACRPPQRGGTRPRRGVRGRRDGHRARPHARAGLRGGPSTTRSPRSSRACPSRSSPTATSTRRARRPRCWRAPAPTR